MPQPAPFDALGTATPAQLLAFLKLLEVEQRYVAHILGLSPQLVSFWARGTRHSCRDVANRVPRRVRAGPTALTDTRVTKPARVWRQ